MLLKNKKGVGFDEAIPLVVFILLFAICYFIFSLYISSNESQKQEDMSKQFLAVEMEGALSTIISSPAGDSTFGNAIVEVLSNDRWDNHPQLPILREITTNIMGKQKIFPFAGWFITVTTEDNQMLMGINEIGVFQDPSINQLKSQYPSSLHEEYAQAYLPSPFENIPYYRARLYLISVEDPAAYGTVP